MKAFQVVAYTYEGAVHCVACTEKRFGEEPSDGYTVEDNEGNTPKPVFAGDEDWENDSCDDCGELIADTL